MKEKREGNDGGGGSDVDGGLIFELLFIDDVC
jgi:hypothetical protein